MLWEPVRRNDFSSGPAHAKLAAAVCLTEPLTEVEQGYKV